MDATQRQMTYSEAVRKFKDNDVVGAFEAFDSIGGYGDSYTYLGYLAMNKAVSGTTMEFAAHCFAVSQKKGDAKAQMLMGELARMVGDDEQAAKYVQGAVAGLEAQAVGGDFFASYLLADYYLSTGDKSNAFTHALKSADSGYCASQFLVSQMYAEGSGTTPDETRAFAYLEKSAYKNYGEAQYALGFRYSKGNGVPQDDDMALKLYQMAAESGISGAAYNLSLWYERAYDENNSFKWLERVALLGDTAAMLKLAMYYDGEKGGDAKEACIWYDSAMKKGSNEACFLLGEHYETGDGVDKNMKKAIEYYESAAAKGYSPAQSKLGYIYKTEEGFKNPERSIYWNDKAAQGDDMRALCNLGISYEFGNGVEKNEKKAFELYRRSARLGYDRGMYNLAYCYMRGFGTNEDHWQAAHYFEKAAQKGHVEAMYNIGVMYLNGDGVNKDCKRAAEWFYKAAQNNNIESIFYLGYCYMNGLGVKKYPAMAVHYFRKAADGGDPEAMFNLGYCYYNGNGVAEDRAQARELWKKAAEAGHAYAREVLTSLGN